MEEEVIKAPETEPDPRREVIREILTTLGRGPAEAEIDSVLAAKDRRPRYDGYQYHKDIPRFGDPADIDY